MFLFGGFIGEAYLLNLDKALIVEWFIDPEFSLHIIYVHLTMLIKLLQFLFFANYFLHVLVIFPTPDSFVTLHCTFSCS